MNKASIILLPFILLSFLSGDVEAQSVKSDTLFNHFISPPNSSRPRVWWHWMNGNITKDGIDKDLKWMKRVGLGGFQNFDAAWSTPQIVKKRLIFMTPEWKDAFLFATKLADSLKLEMAIASSPGWSESGGPWVKPENAMKKIVWSETYVKGGKLVTDSIKHPPSTTGDFQNLSIYRQGSSTQRTEYYKDIAVLAYKLPDDEVLLRELNPKVSSSGGNFNIEQLTDGDIATVNSLPVDSANKLAWIQFEFNRPQTFKSLTIAGGEKDATVNAGTDTVKNQLLQISNDGINFQPVCFIPHRRAVEQTISFPAITAKCFRVLFNTKNSAVRSINISELILNTTSRINRFEEKAGYAVGNDLYAGPTPSSDATPLNEVIDITGEVNLNGKLEWNPPPGNWDIIRFGYSLVGTTNHPASPEATGLEADKMDPDAVKAYFDHYLDLYSKTTNGLMGGNSSLKFLVTDSWEAGASNWTKNMLNEFRLRRGYDMLPWMPVLTGRIVNSSEESEHFLWDFRKTLSELVASYYYDQLTDLLRQRGMKRYSESHEVGRAMIADGMDVKRTAAIPMSAMWTPSIWSGPSENYISDVLESASVAHIYGQNLVAAESFTAFGNAWSWYPEKLKPTADLELACGLNRFVIHTSVHQPTDDKIPGLGLGPFGQWFNRHETWAEEAAPWVTYLSRSSYLLQQGKFVADVVYYYGEDNNITSLFRYKLPDVPKGYRYDFINSDALVNLLSVKNGRLMTPSGMSYRLLALDSNSRNMPLRVLKKINVLVNGGAIVVGPRPLMSPSLADNKSEFETIVHDIWGDNGSKSMSHQKVFANSTIGQALNRCNIKPDFQYSSGDANLNILYVHRRLATNDLYWVNNRSDSAQYVVCTFKVNNKVVEIWHPETGKKELSNYKLMNGFTEVPLHLMPHDAVFVVFIGYSNKSQSNIKVQAIKELATLKGNWNLSFQKDRGAPANITIDKLSSWSENLDPGIKYFSGTGDYSKTVNVPLRWLKKHTPIWMDMGNVKNIAEVIINGKSAGITWIKPYRVEITHFLKPGNNVVTIRVTNLWVNRLIGDQQPNVAKKYTWTTEQFYQQDSPLLLSGLLGPVKILSIQ